jgi:hypothetical protein
MAKIIYRTANNPDEAQQIANRLEAAGATVININYERHPGKENEKFVNQQGLVGIIHNGHKPYTKYTIWARVENESRVASVK